MNKLNLYSLNTASLVKDVVYSLNLAGRDGLAFLHDENSKELLYVFTDGDIRRALLNGISLNANINDLINDKKQNGKSNFIFETHHKSSEELIEKMDCYGIRQIIILDENKTILNIVHREDLVLFGKKVNTSVLIMAGGFGKRLMPYTLETPKPMLKVNEVPLLEVQIDRLKTFNLDFFFISVFYLKDVIKNYFKDGASKGIHINYLEEKNPLGTAGCISLIEDKNFDNLLILNGDIYCPLDITKLINFHTHNSCDITMCVKEFQYQIPYGTIKTDGLNLIEISEKPFINYFVNAGIYIINKDILSHLKSNIKIDITDLIENMRQLNKTIKCYPIFDEWIDMGTPEDYLRLNDKLKNSNNE
jgi:dTDP-glucose pyrophosphorylase